MPARKSATVTPATVTPANVPSVTPPAPVTPAAESAEVRKARTAIERKIRSAVSSGVGNATKIVAELVELFPYAPHTLVQRTDADGKPRTTKAGPVLGIPLRDYVISLGIGGKDGFILPKPALLEGVKAMDGKADNKTVADLFVISPKSVVNYRNELKLSRAASAGTARDADESGESGEATPAAPKRPNIDNLLTKVDAAAQYMTEADVSAFLNILLTRQSELLTAGADDNADETVNA
jgi:hypothetical protein